MVSFELDFDWMRTSWILFGLVLGAAVLWILFSFVGTFVFALFIYYSTRRVHGEIRDRVGQRSTAAALALVSLALPAVLLLMYVSAVGVQELQEFSDTTDLGPFYEAVSPYLNVSQAVENPGTLLQNVGDVGLLTDTLAAATGYLGLVATSLLHLFLMFAVAFYLLRDDHRLVAWARSLDVESGVLEEYAAEVDQSLEKIFAGNILNALVTGSIGAIAYSLLNLSAPEAVAIPYPALIGLLAGLASLIPVVGMKIVYVPVLGYLALQAWMEGDGWLFVTLFGAVSFVIVDLIPDLIVRPYVSGGTLHTGTLMFAYILGPLLFGWYGLFLGPVILVLVTHFGRIVVPAILDGRRSRTNERDRFLSPPLAATSGVATADRRSASSSGTPPSTDAGSDARNSGREEEETGEKGDVEDPSGDET